MTNQTYTLEEQLALIQRGTQEILSEGLSKPLFISKSARALWSVSAIDAGLVMAIYLKKR